MHKTVEVQQLKNLNEAEFLGDLRMIDWNRFTTHNNPNELWDFWIHLLASVIDKHAPFRTKRVKNKRSPWITNEIMREIHKRDFLKKNAASTNDPLIWKQFKDAIARNKVNNSVKKAKRKYFSENLDAKKSDPRKTWRLINELQSRQSKSTKVSQVKTGNQVFTSPGDIAEAFKNHFANRGQSLAHTHKKIPNRAIRVITKSSYENSSRFLLNSHGWDNLSVRGAKQKANLMYKCIIIISMIGHLFQNYDTIYVRFSPTYTCNHSCYTIYVLFFFATNTCVLSCFVGFLFPNI